MSSARLQYRACFLLFLILFALVMFIFWDGISLYIPRMLMKDI